MASKTRGKKAIDLSAENSQWLASLGVRTAKPRWYLNVFLDEKDAPALDIYGFPGDKTTKLRLHVDHEVWHLTAIEEDKARIIDIDDQKLANVHSMIEVFEKTKRIRLKREHARIETNVAGAKGAVRRWLATIGAGAA